MNKVAIILIFFSLMVALSIFYRDSEKPIVDESTYLDEPSDRGSIPIDDPEVNESSYPGEGSNRVCFKDDLCLEAEVVSSSQEISRGLMYREGLDEGKAMLFVFTSDARHGFWMKNMKFPIDMLWISADGEVVHIERSVPPCREDPCPGYASSEKAKYVLETRANFTLENGIDVGSMATIYTS